MLREITLPQLLEWIAYAELEPFDEDRGDLRSAQIVQAMYNLHARRVGDPAFPIEMFLLPIGDRVIPEPPRQSWEDIKAMARLYAVAFSDEDVNRPKPV